MMATDWTPHAAVQVTAKAKPRITERMWQTKVIETATLCGWWHYHTHDSRRSQRGFTDLVLIRPPRIIFAELKTERGRLTSEQQMVLGMLNDCSHVEAYVWRPDDFDHVVSLLTHDGNVESLPVQTTAKAKVLHHASQTQHRSRSMQIDRLG